MFDFRGILGAGGQGVFHRRDAECAEVRRGLCESLRSLRLCGEYAREAMKEWNVTGAIIGAAIEVHRRLGPGLLESAYEECLCWELSINNVPYARQRPLSVDYKGKKLGCAYRVDLLVDRTVVVEVKSIAAIEPVHEAQLLTYMKLGGWPFGLLINFNVPILKSGIRRMILSRNLAPECDIAIAR